MIDNTPTLGGWREAGNKRCNIHTPATDGIDGQYRIDEMLVGVIKIERTRVPAKQLMRGVGDNLGCVERRSRTAQLTRQSGEGTTESLGAFSLGNVFGNPFVVQHLAILGSHRPNAI